jgi:hypothetical protein
VGEKGIEHPNLLWKLIVYKLVNYNYNVANSFPSHNIQNVINPKIVREQNYNEM